MSAAQLVEDEFPARERLKAAQERLAAALVAAEATAQSLARGRKALGELERRRDDAHAEIVDEAGPWPRPSSRWRLCDDRRGRLKRAAK